MTETQRLLATYAGNRSEAAFRELVSRYLDFVHSSAVRLVGEDRHLYPTMGLTLRATKQPHFKQPPTCAWQGRLLSMAIPLPPS